MTKFSQQFEDIISGGVKEIKEELKIICVKMSKEETETKKQELLKSLEAEKQILLQQHEEKMEKIKVWQKEAAAIHKQVSKFQKTQHKVLTSSQKTN